MVAVHASPGDAASERDALEAQLARVGAWLARWRSVWSHRPFRQMPAPWEADHPEVSAWLRGRSPSAIARCDADLVHLLEGPEPLATWVREGIELTRVPAAEVVPTNLRERWERGVPGRKRAQVRAFVGAVLPLLAARPSRWLDWCSGKGHLGRALGSTCRAPLLFVERQAPLAAEASARARAIGLEAEHRVADVLFDAIDAADSAVVGLHACGALGDAALAAAIRTRARIALMPCCYHYQPGHERLVARSAAGRRHPLEVAPQQLRFATAEEVAAPARRRRGREREEAFRLALDLLAREASGEDRYHHVPPVPRPWLSMPFAAWATRVADEHGMVLPARWDADRFEAAGTDRARTARALGLARTPFRRALEIWYVLDRALWLADAGFRVRVRRACPRAVTPRNLLVVADVPAGTPAIM